MIQRSVGLSVADTDRDMMTAVRKGDGVAFEALVRRYQNPLLGFAFRYLGDRQGAQDVVQETFWRVFRFASEYENRGEAGPAAWIFKIAYNLCLNELKRRRRLGVLNEEWSRREELRSVTLAQEARHRDLEQAARTVMAGLPENQRAAMLLRVNQGLSYQEIAQVLDLSVSAVESLIFRARQRLRQALGEGGKEDNHGMS